jgi:hypothetical protein
MGRKDIAKDGKPFSKGDPRINRKGRPKKLPKLDELLAEVLGSETEEGKTAAEQILEAMKKRATHYGDVKAAQLLLDRGYGKVKEKLDITTDGEKINEQKIQIEIVTTVKNEKGENRKS